MPAFLDSEIVGVWPATHCEQNVASNHFRRAFFAIDRHRYSLHMWAKTDTFSIETKNDSFVAQDFFDRSRNFFTFSPDDMRAHLNNCYLTAKTPEHLSEFEAYISAADDHEMFGEEIDVHHRRIRQVRNFVDARQRRHNGSSAYVDEDAIGAEHFAPHSDFFLRFKPGLSS